MLIIYLENLNLIPCLKELQLINLGLNLVKELQCVELACVIVLQDINWLSEDLNLSSQDRDHLKDLQVEVQRGLGQESVIISKDPLGQVQKLLRDQSLLRDKSSENQENLMLGNAPSVNVRIPTSQDRSR